MKGWTRALAALCAVATAGCSLVGLEDQARSFRVLAPTEQYFYFWREDAATGFREQLAGELLIVGSEVRIIRSHDLRFSQAVATIAQKPALEMRIERMVDGRRVMYRQTVTRSDPDYPWAFADTMARETGFRWSTRKRPG